MIKKIKPTYCLWILYSIFILASCTKAPVSEQTTPKSVLKPSANNVTASSIGIGSGSYYYHLTSINDLIVPYDYNNTGFQNQIICYRPGSGLFSILENTAPPTSTPNFIPRYTSTTGIGSTVIPYVNYNLTDLKDRVIPYDAYGTGIRNYLICYRPGTGIFWIFAPYQAKSDFPPILESFSGVGSGSNNYNLTDTKDVIVPFDYYNTGKATELLIYRPGSGICWVMHNTAPFGTTPNFVAVFKSYNGIGAAPYNYDLLSPSDIILPYDVLNTGIVDGILIYRPGTGILASYSHGPNDQTFNIFQFLRNGLYSQKYLGSQHYDLMSPNDRITPYDYGSTGTKQQVLIYRPGYGIAWMFDQMDLNTNNIRFLSYSGLGTPNYNLLSTNDKAFAYDFSGTGKIDHLFIYRPGSNLVYIYNNALNQIY
jgi:hypothetical protein